MSSDTDSSSVSSDEFQKRHSSKKSKRKSAKKHKKEKKLKKSHKQKKRSRRDSIDGGSAISHPTPRPILPVLPLAHDVEENAFGPALPPHLLQRACGVDVNEEDTPKIIGPVMPSTFTSPKEIDAVTFKVTHPNKSSASEDEANDHVYGPVPIAPGVNETQMTTAQRELEQRALEIKLAAIEGANATTTIDQKEREEWMLELPEVGLKTGLAALVNIKRTFHQGKERPDFSDRSSWTKTPQGDGNTPQKSSTSKHAAEELRQEAQANYVRQRDAEQESIAKKHKKKHKRDESLVEIHQKKLRKEQREREKELAASGAKAERRPFSRDVDLKLNKIDSHQTKQIVDKAKILNTKFSTGHTKYL